MSTNSNPLVNTGALDDFLPRAKATVSHEAEVSRTEKASIRQSAEDRGFVIDNLSATVRAKRNSKASKSHTLRLHIHDINRFQTWCNDNDYTQARGFELLLDKLLS